MLKQIEGIAVLILLVAGVVFGAGKQLLRNNIFMKNPSRDPKDRIKDPHSEN